MFSGGEIGCDGPLPGVTGGENEVFAQLPGAAGIRRTDAPKFTTPAYPGPVKQLPVGYRVQRHRLDLHGDPPAGWRARPRWPVRCYAFQVTPTGVSTFGG